ncbi:hypothetical protein MSTE_00410 [Mycobacteroides stephanolepidis]|uniref:Uncharacterized protein n=1 Tax=[Mycobacterium] stephanolepidis TaxID=1520670 RepID=A0A1Z4ES41_9MYCO|nr:hypothetical protein [[Mycobacterium] stephanolepidis]BAX95753.1 hypothetical protein MSTE_00410 [[Mycobacterium] stephanolepidis]
MANEIVGFVGVYNGDGGVRGELAWVLGKLRGTASCALCDITHRGIRSNPEWKDLACTLGVPIDLVHRNERSIEIERLTGDLTPAVVAQTTDGDYVVMGPEDFTGASGDAVAFVRTLRQACMDRDLVWPGIDVAELGESAR